MNLTDEDILAVAREHCEFTPEGAYHLRKYPGFWAIVAVVRECIQRASIVMGEAIENAHSAPCETAVGTVASSGPDENRTASVGGASAQVQAAEATKPPGVEELTMVVNSLCSSGSYAALGADVPNALGELLRWLGDSTKRGEQMADLKTLIALAQKWADAAYERGQGSVATDEADEAAEVTAEQAFELELRRALDAGVQAERERCAAIADDEARIRESAGRQHPEDSEARDRCFAGARAAANVAKGIRSGEVVSGVPPVSQASDGTRNEGGK